MSPNRAIGARLPGWRGNAPAPGGQARADFRRGSKIGGEIREGQRAARAGVQSDQAEAASA
jgi:hypothetical protein